MPRWTDSAITAPKASLRRTAEEKLGEQFDITAFHDMFIANGNVSLPMLGAAVNTWIADSLAEKNKHLPGRSPPTTRDDMAGLRVDQQAWAMGISRSWHSWPDLVK
jgi:hypothetical protein